MRTVPDFVPELCEKFSVGARKPLKIIWIDGAGRGNRTPMELLPTDFEPDVAYLYRQVPCYMALHNDN